MDGHEADSLDLKAVAGSDVMWSPQYIVEGGRKESQ